MIKRIAHVLAKADNQAPEKLGARGFPIQSSSCGGSWKQIVHYTIA
jgi:hypothetical protein